MRSTELGIVFAASLACAGLITATAPWHARWTSDPANAGIQKHHQGQPPRVGLIPISVGLLAGLLLMSERADGAFRLFGLLLLSCAPAALAGLTEDLTKRVRARWRLLAPMVGTGIAVAVLDARIPSMGIPGLDFVNSVWALSVLFTAVMLTGYTQAMNIVDGLNGLASGLAILMLAATIWVAQRVGDTLMVEICLIALAATAGFFVLNFPRGLMFLGDGGAYLLGFLLALVWVMLLIRNPGAVSPWCVMAISGHATFETVFSIIRRRGRKRRRNATAPDRLHLHSLMFRRQTRGLASPDWRRSHVWALNSLAACLILGCAAVPMILATLRPESHVWNFGVLALSVGAYLFQFRRIVRFQGWRLPERWAPLSAQEHGRL